MAVKSEFKGRSLGVSFIFALILCLFGSVIAAQQPDAVSQAPRYRVFALKHISAQQGKKYLDDIQIGTASQLPGNPNTLLVTASQADLVKATSILNLVDANTQFVFNVICPASELSQIPSNKQLEKVLSDHIAVGTLFDPPPFSAPLKAIVDVHDDKVIAIVSAPQLEKITNAVLQFKTFADRTVTPESGQIQGTNKPPQLNKSEAELLQSELTAAPESKKTVTSPKKPPRTVKPTENGEDLFGKLVSSLDEAEKQAAEKPAAPAVPKQPPVTRVVQKLQEPNLTGVITQKKPTESNLRQPTIASPYEVNQAVTLHPTPAAEKVAPPAERRSYEPEPNASVADATLDLNLPERLNIIDLLGLVGEYLHLDYMYDADKIKGDVTLKLRGPIKVKELYPLLESVLRFRGFAMTRRGNLVTIVPNAESLDIDPTLLQDESGKVRYGDVVVTRFFDLKFIDTNNAKGLLDGMKLSVNVTPIPEAGTLIVTGYAYRMSRIEELLDIIDKPGPPKQFRFRPLKYTMAAALAPKVKALVEQLGEISITVGASTGTTPTPATPSRTTPLRTRPQTKPPGGAESAGTKPTVYLDADERTNRILMIGFDEQLNTVDQLIDSLDVEKQDLRSIRLYDIQHVGAEEVKNKLIELGIIGGEMQTSPYRTMQPSRITAARPPEASQPAVGAAGAISVTDQPIVVILESTNSLLVNATPEQHTQIASIIAYVDTETLQMAVPYEVYPLENQDPKNLAEVLTKFVQETTKDKEGKIERVTKREEDIVIVPDENTFSIIVYASKKNQEWIKKLITSLDRRRPQVLIDCTLVEITKGDTFNYDLNLIANARGLVGQNTIIPTLLSDSNSLSSNKARNYRLEGNSDGGSGQAFYADNHIQALLTAIQTKSYGRVLAKPKILVDDGSEGDIQTKTTTSYQTQTVQVPTTGSTVQSTNFSTIDATIELKITPHISEGDLLRLDVSMSRDDFSLTRPFADGPPDKTTSLVKTTVFVPDDKTVILGGLVKLNQNKGGSKVPILGDIPLVGALFRSSTDRDTESKLYIFLKANIVRPATEGKLHDLQEISEEHRKAFEKGERRFQKYEDWPGIKPKPMEPNKVLDEL